jgi:chromosome segregation ATPase
MPTLGEFINSALQKAGIAADNEYLKRVLQNPELTKETVPDEIVSQFNSTLLTLDQAKTNYDLKNHFYGAALAPVEKELQNLATAYELSDEEIAEINAVKSTFSKIPALKAKLDNAIQRKAVAAGGDKNQHAQEIVRLNAEIAAAKAEMARLLPIIKAAEAHQYEASISILKLLGNFMYRRWCRTTDPSRDRGSFLTSNRCESNYERWLFPVADAIAQLESQLSMVSI